MKEYSSVKTRKGNLYRKKGISWFHLFPIFFLVIVAGYLRISRLGETNFYNDEFYHVEAATGLLKGVGLVRWNFLQERALTVEEAFEKQGASAGNLSPAAYPRAPFTTYQVALAFKTFGVSETSARIPSVLWGLLLVVVVYFIAKFFFGSVYPSLFAATVVAFDPTLVVLSREVRMYSMLHVLVLLATFLVALGVCRLVQNKRIPSALLMVGGGSILFIFLYVIHPIAFLVLPGLVIGIAVFFVWNAKSLLKAMQLRGRRYGFLLGIVLVVIPIVLVFIFRERILQLTHSYVHLHQVMQQQFIRDLWVNTHVSWLYGMFVVVGLGWMLYLALRSKHEQAFVFLLLACAAIGAALVRAYATTWVGTGKYISHVIPFIAVLAAGGLAWLVHLIHTRIRSLVVQRVVSILTTIVAIGLCTHLSFPAVKERLPYFYTARADVPVTASRPNYERGYEVLRDMEKRYELALMVAPRRYYLAKKGIHLPFDGVGRTTTVERFVEIIRRANVGSIVWADKGGHLDNKIRQCVTFYGTDVSVRGTFVFVFKLDAVSREHIVRSGCVLTPAEAKKADKKMKVSPAKDLSS